MFFQRSDDLERYGSQAAAIARLVKERNELVEGLKRDKAALERRVSELESRPVTAHNPAFSAPYGHAKKYEVIYHPRDGRREPYACQIDAVAEYTDGHVKLHVRSEEHRDEAVEYPEWEGSYTKRVVDALKNALAGTPTPRPVFRTAYAAIKLLEDYHRTQHEVYASRDEARAERDTARKEVDQLTFRLNMKQAFLTIARDGRLSAIKERQALHEKLKQARELLDSTEPAG